MYYVWHKKYSDLDLWKGDPTRGKFPSSLDRRVMLVYLSVSFKKTHTHTHAFNNDSEQQMCQKDKLEFKIFQVLRANDLFLVQKPFFSSFSFLFHKSMKFTFRWALNSNFITWCQNTTSTKETTIPTLPNPSNSHYARSFDSFHLMIVHMFVAAFCWSAPLINLAYSRRSHCGESLQGDVSRKNIRGMG